MHLEKGTALQHSDLRPDAVRRDHTWRNRFLKVVVFRGSPYEAVHARPGWSYAQILFTPRSGSAFDTLNSVLKSYSFDHLGQALRPV